MNRILAVVAVLAPVQCVAQETRPARTNDLAEAALTITEADFARRVGVIAHDSMAGRDTPSDGLDATAEWLASELARLGLRGGAEDGAFIQRYPLTATALDATISSGSTRLRTGDDLVPARGSAGNGSVSAEVVLVSGSPGARPRIPGSQIRGKHVVIVRPPATPRDRTNAQLTGALLAAGAASVIVSQRLDEAAWASRAASASGRSVAKGWDDTPEARSAFRAALAVRADALERLLAGRGVDLAALERRADDRLRFDAVDGLTVTVAQESRIETISAPNVVAILDGSDPDLAAEHVVFSAHMDHVGTGTPDAAGDSIFNGADDDASGTVAVVEVAEAMASLATPPRRSMIFLLVSGEEKGLWGSEWYSEHPSVPVERIVADLNMDMVGRNWPDTIVAIGKEHSDLGTTLAEVNGRHPELGMTAIDDLWPDERFYFRSDHFNFARRGVPILFFFNGTHDDYHGRDDEPDRIDAEKAARIARLVFYLGAEVGNRDRPPEWDPESYAQIVSGRN